MGDELRIVIDIDSEPEPLRSQLWALVNAGAAQLDELENEAEQLLANDS